MERVVKDVLAGLLIVGGALAIFAAVSAVFYAVETFPVAGYVLGAIFGTWFLGIWTRVAAPFMLPKWLA